MATLFLDTCPHMNRKDYASGYNWRVGKKAMSPNEVCESGFVLTNANYQMLKTEFKLIQREYPAFWAVYGQNLENTLKRFEDEILKKRKPTKYLIEYVTQENWGYGWDDVDFAETIADAKRSIREYRENSTANAVRQITRRVPNPAYQG